MQRTRLWVENDKLTKQRDEVLKSLSEMKSLSDNLTLKTNQLKNDKDLLMAINSSLTHERDELQTNCSEMKSIVYNLTQNTTQLEIEKKHLNAINNNLTNQLGKCSKTVFIISHCLDIKTFLANSDRGVTYSKSYKN